MKCRAFFVDYRRLLHEKWELQTRNAKSLLKVGMKWRPRQDSNPRPAA